MIPQKASQLLAIGRILMDPQLEIFAELLVEFLEIVLVLCHLLHQLHHLLHQILPDHLQNLVLLAHLPCNVEGQVFAVNDPPDEVDVVRDDLVTVVNDEDSPHVQLDVVLSLRGRTEAARPPRVLPPLRASEKSGNPVAEKLKCF